MARYTKRRQPEPKKQKAGSTYDASNNPLAILKIGDVEALINHSKATVYRWMKSEKFPKQVTLDGRAIGWRQGEVNEWLKNLQAGQ
jgi:prophage regulatory protein